MEEVKDKSSHIEKYAMQVSKDTERTEKLNIALYLTSKTVSLLGTNIYNFALSLFILKVTGSGTSFAINVLIGMVPRIILGPFAGVLADRVDRKKLSIILDIFSGVTVFLLLGISYTLGLKLIFIYISGFILSTINVFYDTALTSSLPNLVTDKRLMKINSYSAATASLSGVLSPILAGIIYGLVPISLFLIINGVSFIFSSVLEIFISFNLNKELEVSSKTAMTFSVLKIEIREIIDFIRRQKVIYSLLKYILMINFFLSASISVVYPYMINNVLKMSSSEFGIFQGCYFVGMIVWSILIGNQKEKKINVKSLAAKITLLGVIFILLGVPTIGIYVFKIKLILIGYNVILLFTVGATLVAMNIPILVSMQRLTPEKLRGRITGILGTLTSGITPLGIILAGLAIDKIHPFIILMVSGLFIILAALPMFGNKYTEMF